MKSEYYSYCFVRTDLTWPERVVQAGHAWWDVARWVALDEDERGTLESCNFVLIGVANEEALVDLGRKMRGWKVPYRTFYETGGGLGFTALATSPITGSARDPLLGFPLLTENEPCPSTPKLTTPA